MKLFEMQRIEGRTAIWLEGSRCFLASNIYRRVSLSRILIHMPGAGWGDTELCCRFQAAEYANTSPCITVFRSYHATGKTYQFHWPHSTLQQVWMLDNVRCVCPYMWVSQNGCPLHVHESFRWIQNCDIIYGIRCTPCTWELLPKLFQIIHNFKQVIHCTGTWPDRIMPGSYPLTSNILCLTCFFRSFPYLHACCIYIYIANQPKLWNVWGRGHERTVFWQLVSAYFRQPGGRHAGESLEVRSAEHWCNSRNRFAVPFVGNCCEFILVLFFFHPYIQEFLTIGWTGLLRKLGTHLFNWKFLRFLRYYMTSLSFSTNAPTHHVPLYTSLQRIPKYLPLASFPSHICTKFSCDSNARIPWITSAWPTTALSGPHFAAAERRIRWIWMLGWVFWNKCFHVHPYSRNFLPGVLLCTTHVFTLVATN